MLRRLLAHVTYGNVVASAALFIALGGVSYAAIKLPKNSVGAKQIKANAVTSAKVKNRSLATSDLGTGALGTLKGAPGAPGLQGPKGDKGDTGRPFDRGLLDSANWLGGTAVAELTVDGFPAGTLKGYRIDCDNLETACTLKGGGPMNSNIEFDAWHEQSRVGDDEGATKSFTLTERTAPAGTMLRRYHITNGKPIAFHTQNDRFEITWIAEFIQRVSV